MKFTIVITDFQPIPSHSAARLRCRPYRRAQAHPLRRRRASARQRSPLGGLPAKPIIDRDGNAKRTGDGQIEYVKLFGFDSRAVADAFSRR